MLKHYLVYALRTFAQHKLTTAVNLFGLSLGLVCFIATYVFIDGITRTDTHFPKASRTWVITQELWTSPTEMMIPAFPQAAPPTAKYLEVDFPQLEAVARAISIGSVAAAAGERKIDVAAAAVDPEFLDIFDFNFVAGGARDALAASDRVILTTRTAERLFGTRAAVGRSLLLQNRSRVTVSGVIEEPPRTSHMGETTRSMLRFGLLIPMAMLREMRTFGGIGVPLDPDSEVWGNDVFLTYALLPEDGSLTPAQFLEGLRTFGQRHVPPEQIIAVFDAVPLPRIYLANMEALVESRGISLLTSLLVLDALILLIACVNYANLAVAMASTRGKEIGMRRVLGANRLHLIRQYLIEAGLLGTAALIIVVLGTVLALPSLNRTLGLQLQLPPFTEPGIWLWVGLLIGVISLAGGAYPALVLSRVRPVEAVRTGMVRAGPRFVPTLLVGVQFAAASFLLVLTLLMAAQNRMLERVGIREGQDPVVVLLNDVQQLGLDFETVRAELLRSPTVKSVSGSAQPVWQNGGWHFMLRRSPDASLPELTTILNQVSHDFFDTIGLRQLAGRALTEDHGDAIDLATMFRPATEPFAVVIDRSLARQLGWADPAAAVNELIYPALSGGRTGSPMRVVGVVEDGYPRLIGPNTDTNMYMLMPGSAASLLVRIARDDIPAALAHIDATWERLVPNAPLRREFMDDLFTIAYADMANLNRMLGGLAAFAFVIAMMGLFGMAVHVTARRRREIGIRKTLGAGGPRIVLMLLRDFARPVVIANVLAWPLAFVAGRLYLELFVQRTPLSPWPFVLSLAITVAVAWAAVAAQAVRAASVNPARVLRVE